MIHHQTLLPHPYTQQAGAASQGLAFGGIRKTVDQIIGNLGSPYVLIDAFTTDIFAPPAGIITNLAAGTVQIATPGLYQGIINIEATFTADNNQSRKTNVRIFDVTAGAAVPNALMALYAGGYTSGFSSAVSLMMTLTLANHVFRLEIGNGDAFTTFVIRQAAFAFTSIGPV